MIIRLPQFTTAEWNTLSSVDLISWLWWGDSVLFLSGCRKITTRMNKETINFHFCRRPYVSCTQYILFGAMWCDKENKRIFAWDSPERNLRRAQMGNNDTTQHNICIIDIIMFFFCLRCPINLLTLYDNKKLIHSSIECIIFSNL